MTKKTWLAGCVAAGLLIACDGGSEGDSTRTEAAKVTTPPPPVASAFDAALAKKYLEFAESEKAKYDWSSAGIFAKKAESAAAAVPVAPEALSDWNIPDYAVSELTQARETLLNKLTPAYKQQAPQLAAQTQYYFDCWVEEQEEAWEIPAIEYCRNGFYRLLEEDDLPVMAQGGPLSTSYLLHFGWDRTKLPQSSLAELRDMASQLQQGGQPYRVVINGHADRSGSSDYNMQLSQERAAFVRDLLVDAGLYAQSVDYFAFGESDPAEATPDGVRSYANRRVEIYIE
jgi:outer membrane protein OmpA-like peptidoglycan-associated protein